MPATPCADSAPTGSSMTLSIASTPSDDDHAGDEADDRRRPELDVARRRRDRHERRDRAVADHADVERASVSR